MAQYNILLKLLNKLGVSINPATEDTLATLTKPSDQQHAIVDSGTVAVSSLPTGLATSSLQQTDALTNAELRASAVLVNTGLVQPTTPADTQPVSGAIAVSNFPATQSVSGSVAVSNFPATQPVSGIITANQGAAGASAWPVSVNGIPSGTPSYASGASGTVSVPAGAKVTAVVCHCTTAGSLTISGGSSIPVPASSSFFDSSTPYVGAISIVFTGTDSYYVAWVI